MRPLKICFSLEIVKNIKLFVFEIYIKKCFTIDGQEINLIHTF